MTSCGFGGLSALCFCLAYRSPRGLRDAWNTARGCVAHEGVLTSLLRGQRPSHPASASGCVLRPPPGEDGTLSRCSNMCTVRRPRPARRVRRTARREQGTDAAVLRWKRNQKSLREHSPNICEMSRSLVASMGSFDLTGTRLALLIGGA